uniref:Uncharacterized protein n=1 Tax=Anguilla anguilla TaxID=7936 RepID=A0A0E9QKR0_ANGAN
MRTNVKMPTCKPLMKTGI